MGDAPKKTAYDYTSRQISVFRSTFLGIAIISLLLSVIIFRFSIFFCIVFFSISAVSYFFSYSYKQLQKNKEIEERAKNNNNTDLCEETKVDQKKTITIPRQKDGCNLVYQYGNLHVILDDYKTVYESALRQEFDLSADIVGNKPYFFINGNKIGTLADEKKANMLCDWIKRNDPYVAYVENVFPDEKSVDVFIAFYRDEEKRLSHRESFVTKLTAYSSEDKQIIMHDLHEGEKLTVDEDRYNENTYNVLNYAFESIGNLPAKFARMYEDDPFAGVFVDRIEYDDKKDKYIPYVRIYK